MLPNSPSVRSNSAHEPQSKTVSSTSMPKGTCFVDSSVNADEEPNSPSGVIMHKEKLESSSKSAIPEEVSVPGPMPGISS
jgi:hypothetical protein